MARGKIPLDKYYTKPNLAKYVVEKTREVVGIDNIVEYLEPSAGEGVFLQYLDKPYLAYDIEPKGRNITKQDYLSLVLPYKKGRCAIGNPPFGSRMALAVEFYKKLAKEVDYIAFILPISQLDNTNSLYEFDLIHSEDLGLKVYTDRDLHCCFNIYKRPASGDLNGKKINRLKDVTIIRQDNKRYNDITEYDIRMCYWGDGTAGKILNDNEKYSGEYKIIINNSNRKDEIKNFIINYDWNNYIDGIAMKRLKQWQMMEVLKNNIKGIE